MHDNAPVANEGRRALDKAREVVGESAGDLASGEFLADLAAEVADLAEGELAGVAGGLLAGVVGVEVGAGGGAGAGGVDWVHVDVEGWGVLVGGFLDVGGSETY